MEKEVRMVSTVSAQVNIKADRKLRLTLPSSVPVGPAQVIVVVAPTKPDEPTTGTANDLAASRLFGLWRNRTDLPDSVTFARQLRAKAERRNND
jgi:hypothetical protein